MAIIRLEEGEIGRIRPGDLVFHFNKDEERFPLHVGIYVDAETAVGAASRLRVRGVPGERGNNFLGDSVWGAPDGYHVSIVGQRTDVDSAELKRVVVRSEQLLIEGSQLPGGHCCEWSMSMRVERRLPGSPTRFVSGSCAHFVEWLYESIGLDIVDQLDTYDPDWPSRIYPATQIRAFWKERYPLAEGRWSVKFSCYPDCLE